MFDGPTTPQVVSTVTDVLIWVRELSVIGIFLTCAWKARGVYDDILQFVERIENHMSTMENFAKTAVENHLTHIEESLEKIANFQDGTDDQS